jgi:hypothetical protein
VLDAPSYVSRTGHRWLPAQLADAQRQAAGSANDASHFVSHAQGAFPIFTWPRAGFRAGAAFVVVLLLAMAFIAGRRVDYPVSQGAHR